MKATLTTSFLMCIAFLGLKPAQASSRDPERATPSVGVLAGGGIGARPLVRYLAATLQLSPAQTAAVQQALGRHRRWARTPELLAQRLQAVLAPSEFEQLLQLRDDVRTARSLHYLALR